MKDNSRKPVDKFNEWLESAEGKLVQSDVLNYTKVDTATLDSTINSLRLWLIRYEQSPRAQKKSWKRFLLNNLSLKGSGKYGSGKGRVPLFESSGASGQRKF